MEQGFLAGVSQGWQAGTDIEKSAAEQPYIKQRASDNASLLSTKAAEQRLAVQEHQRQYTDQMASRAAMTKSMEGADLKSSQDTMNFWQKAADVAKDPAIKLQMLANKEAEQAKINDNTIRAGKAKEANQLLDVAAIKEAFTDPTASASKLRAVGLQTGNQALGRLADQMENNAPIQAPGLQGRTFSSLSSDERNMYLDYLDKQLGPKSEQRSISEVLRIAQRAKNEQDRLEIEDQKSRDRQAAIAARRNGDESKAKAILAKSSARDSKGTHAKESKDIVAIDEKQNKLLVAAGVSDPAEKDSAWWKGEFSKLPEVQQAQYKRYENQKKIIHEGYGTDRTMLDHTDKPLPLDSEAIKWAKDPKNAKDPRAIKYLADHPGA